MTQYPLTLNCWTQNGSWIFEGETSYLYPVDVPIWMRNSELITPVYDDCGDAQQRVGLGFVWKTPTCPELPSFSPDRMCREMRGRTLVFVGDSLTIAHFETTIQAMAHGRPIFVEGNNGCPSFSKIMMMFELIMNIVSAIQ